MSDARIKNLEIKYRYYYDRVLESSSYLFDIMLGAVDKIDPDEKQFAEYWTQRHLERMYNILCVYFETIALPEYLKGFKSKFEPIINDPKRSIGISSEILQDGDSVEDLYLILEWQKILAPFEFHWKNEERENHTVIDFLENTNEILKITKTEVYKEESINKVVRDVARLFFNEVISYAEGYFAHQFQHYRPDIIIKELRTAIEYKLIREEKDIGAKLDELLIDAKRYVGNENNKYCIAVFCLSTRIHRTKKEIRADWKNMKFPQNWELVIVSDVVLST